MHSSGRYAILRLRCKAGGISPAVNKCFILPRPFPSVKGKRAFCVYFFHVSQRIPQQKTSQIPHSRHRISDLPIKPPAKIFSPTQTVASEAPRRLKKSAVNPARRFTAESEGIPRPAQFSALGAGNGAVRGIPELARKEGFELRRATSRAVPPSPESL